ncbi:RHS repeat protein, partial [Escherichia coli]|nr:RHS repeat protein [Escherichia coli]EHY4400726.1 RHS repeat protein [Escherichia coli]EHZ9017181.1 RHS repeat protein [Escherichia coli]EJW7359648.1 RHS repeat protein [Escherichia coli]EKC5440715.1 RHS repeat protein [Escherichia coli]
GLASRCIPDSLPAVEWLTYGSGWLAGMKLGDTPLVDFTRDRLHRETLRSFGRYELTTAYTPAGQLQRQHLNSLQYDRDYTWNDNGELIRISSPRQTRSYSYSDSGRLTGVHTTAANLDIRIPYATDPAGNRLPDPELHPDSTLSMWPDNRIARDAHYLYRYDRHGRLTEKTDLIPEGVIRTDDERTHRYHYDSQHRLVHYTRTQYAEPLVESRYLYDPLGRRVAKRVWRRERDLTGWMSLSRKPQVTWYGWDGDRLTTIQNDRTRIQTIYQPGSFTPLIRVETATGEQAKTQRRSLADTLQQSGGEDGGSVVFPPVLVQMLDRLESEILADRVSEESRRWLASCGLTVEQMQNQMDPVYTPARKIHLYHCDHRGLPLALISAEGATEWCAEYDEWGNLLNEENPHQLQQLIRLPGQQYDEESGLYYNRHRYYDPLQGRYITQDPIGLKGGWNFYQYPLNPVQYIDPLGLDLLSLPSPRQKPVSQSCTIDPITQQPVGRFIGDSKGNIMVEPVGGRTIPYPPSNPGSADTHTLYQNNSNAYRLNPIGHANNSTPHAHLPGTGSGMKGQGPSLDVNGRVVPWNSSAAHIGIRSLGTLSFFSSVLHMFTLRSCKEGTFGQCYCAMYVEMSTGSNQDEADIMCGMPEYF